MQGLLQHQVLREAQLLHGSYQKALDRLLNQACCLLLFLLWKSVSYQRLQHPTR